MEILKSGKMKERVETVRCPICTCTYRYDYSDIIVITERTDYNKSLMSFITVRKVYCPECGCPHLVPREVYEK